MNNATHIVLTTIGDGRILLDLSENVCRHGQHATVWVIADHKTPPACRANAELAGGCGLDVHYLSPADQDEAGKRFPIYPRLPWNSDARRNLGYLLAYEAGCERLILLDDDNFPTGSDLVGDHGVVGSDYAGAGASCASGYYDYLQAHSDCAVAPRGLPYYARPGLPVGSQPVQGRVGVNVGVWAGDPDVDAVSWLAHRPRVGHWRGLPVVLAPGTWTPINSQNTCIARDLIPAAFFVIQRYPGIEVMDRYGDIFAGYFLQAAIGGDNLVRIGEPMVHHRRNRHNYIADLAQEAPAIALLEWLLPELEEFRSSAASVAARYMDLADYLAGLNTPPGRLEWGRHWLLETSGSMSAYACSCLDITGERA